MSDRNKSEAYTIVCPDDDPNWPELRRLGVGGSDSPILTGHSPYGSWLQLAAVKLGTLPDFEGNEITRAGSRLEPVIGEWALEEMAAEDIAEGRTPRTGKPYGFLIRSNEVEWMQCTPDWLILEEGNPVPFQIKNTMWKADEWDEGVPAAVMVQVQHEMMCFGSPWAYVAVLLTGNRLRWTKVMPDRDIQELILDVGADFWSRLQNNLEMPVDGSEHTKKALFAMHPDDNGETIALNAELMVVARELDELKEEAKTTEKAIALATNRIKSALGDATFGTFPDGSGFSFKTQVAHLKPREATDVKSRVLRRQRAK